MKFFFKSNTYFSNTNFIYYKNRDLSLNSALYLYTLDYQPYITVTLVTIPLGLNSNINNLLRKTKDYY